MSELKPSARQHTRAAFARITFTDIASGGAADLFTKLGNGVIPVSLRAIILTPFNGVTSSSLSVGTAAAPGAYINGASVKGAAGTFVDATALPGVISTDSGGLQLQASRADVGGNSTAGEVLVALEYIEADVEQFSQG